MLTATPTLHLAKVEDHGSLCDIRVERISAIGTPVQEKGKCTKSNLTTKRYGSTSMQAWLYTAVDGISSRPYFSHIDNGKPK